MFLDVPCCKLEVITLVRSIKKMQELILSHPDMSVRKLAIKFGDLEYVHPGLMSQEQLNRANETSQTIILAWTTLSTEAICAQIPSFIQQLTVFRSTSLSLLKRIQDQISEKLLSHLENDSEESQLCNKCVKTAANLADTISRKYPKVEILQNFDSKFTQDALTFSNTFRSMVRPEVIVLERFLQWAGEQKEILDHL